MVIRVLISPLALLRYSSRRAEVRTSSWTNGRFRTISRESSLARRVVARLLFRHVTEITMCRRITVTILEFTDPHKEPPVTLI